MERQSFLSIVKETQAAGRYKTYFNTPNKVRQSSCALLFRISPNYHKYDDVCLKLRSLAIKFSLSAPQNNILGSTELEIILSEYEDILFQCLFIKRVINENDIHCGQLEFPGGKSQGGENDFETVVREVKEKIGIEVDEQTSLYLGKLPKNFYSLQTNLGESLFTSLHIFLWASDKEIKTTLQTKKVREVLWIDLKAFLKIEKENIQIYRFYGPFNLNMLPQILRRYAQSAKNYFQYGEFCSINVGNDNILWGIAFYFVVYILSLIKFSLVGNIYEKELENVENLLEKSSHFKLVFDHNYYLGGIINFLTQKAHRQQRTEQFKFKSPQELSVQAKKKLVCLSFATILPATVIAFPFYRSAL